MRSVVASGGRPPVAGGVAVTRHGLLYLVGAALQGLAVLLATPVTTRILGEQEYGSVATAVVIVQMTATVLAAGFPQLILRDRHRDDGWRNARTFVGLMIVGAVLAAGVGSAVLVVLAAAGVMASPLVPTAVLLGACGLVVVIGAQSLFRAEGRPVAFVLTAAASTVGALVVGALAALASPRAEIFLGGYAGVLVVLAVALALMVRPVWPWRHRVYASSALRSGAALLPHGAAMLVLLSGDTLIAGWALGPTGAATYQPALQLGNVTFVAVTALYNAWGPALYRRDLATRWSWMTRSAAVLAALVGAGAALVAMTAPWSIPVFVAPGFDREAMVGLLEVLAWTAVPYVFYLGSSLAVIDVGRTRSLATVTSMVAVLFVVVGLLVVPRLGLGALALAKIVSYVLLAAATAWLARRAVGSRFATRDLLAVGGPALLAVAAAVALGPARAVWLAGVLALVAAWLLLLFWRRRHVILTNS